MHIFYSFSLHNQSLNVIRNGLLKCITDALSNLQGFFSNLAHNMDEIESKNLLPNQMRLLGEAAYRDPGTYGHSAAFLHAVRNYRPSKNIRTLVEYEPGQ